MITSIQYCIENPGTYDIKIGREVSGRVISENGFITNNQGELFTPEDIWMIESFEEENCVEYIKVA